MKKKIDIRKISYILLMLLLPPITIEMLSGSTPPLQYLNPLTILFFTVAYGLPFILIRELKTRWNLTWSFIFLFPIQGIYIEGILMQSFFNTAHADLGILSNFGVYNGIQWPWSIYLIIMHGLFSFLVPMFILDVFYPKMKGVTVLKPLTTIISLLLITLLTLLQYFIIQTGETPMYEIYQVDIPRTLICLLIISILIGLSYLFKNVNFKKTLFYNRKRDHLYGFIYMILLLFATYLLAQIGPIITVTAQLLLTLVLLIFSIQYIYRTTRKTDDLIPLYNGLIIYFSLIAIMQEIGMIENIDPTSGMATVGFLYLVLTIVMNIIVYRRKRKLLLSKNV